MGKFTTRFDKSFEKIGIVLLVINISGFLSCINSSNSKPQDNSSVNNNRYKEGLSLFNKKFIDHFPASLNRDPIFFGYFTDKELDSYRIVLIQKKKKEEIHVICDSVQNLALAVYNAYDSCNLVLNRFTNKNNWFEQKKAPKGYNKFEERDCYADKYPVPNFWRSKFTTETTDCRLPDDFKIYVIQAKKGRNFDEKYLTDGRYMPEAWTNGYSKGVAVSKKINTIIYWFIIW